MSQLHFTEWSEDSAPDDEAVQDGNRAPLEALATRYLSEWREGRNPSVEAYAAARPDLAESAGCFRSCWLSKI
jgi:hypothetical protein